MAEKWWELAKIKSSKTKPEWWYADLYGCDCGRVQLGTIFDCLGSEEGDELLKRQLHIVPLTSLGVKAPAGPHLACESKAADLFMVDFTNLMWTVNTWRGIELIPHWSLSNDNHKMNIFLQGLQRWLLSSFLSAGSLIRLWPESDVVKWQQDGHRHLHVHRSKKAAHWCIAR